jgi:sugar/nucleoside kinase (ribokinase family)
MKVELVVLGNLLVDDVVYADGSTRMGQAGGTLLYVALAAQLNGLKVGLVSFQGDDYPRPVLETLARRGIDLSGVQALDGPGLRTWLLYEGRQRRLVHRLEGPSHEEVSPTSRDIPERWRNAGAFHLAPMPFRIQQELVLGLGASGDALISLDPYELLSEANLDAWRGLLRGVDTFFLSEDEMLLPRGPAAVLADGRLRQVVYKRGRLGGELYDAGRVVTWDARTEAVVEPTGAGDCFAAGFLAAAIRGESPERGLERGIVSASFVLEAAGAEGLVAATPELFEQRLRSWFS